MTKIKNNKIKAVIFDFGSVLVKWEWGTIYRKIAKKLKMPEEKTREIIWPLLKKWSKGGFDEEKFWEKFEKRIREKLPPEFKKDLLCYQIYKERGYIKEAWKILVELKKRKLRLALLSNIIPPHVKINKKIGRFKRLKKLGFETLVLSCEVGYHKPEPKIYKIALKRLNLSAKECLFIDDKLVNVEAAKKLGMSGIHFQTPKQLKRGLIELGLL